MNIRISYRLRWFHQWGKYKIH